MTLTKAKQLFIKLGAQQCYDLCNDWMDEADVHSAVRKGIIPELAFQAMCRGAIPERAVKQKINSMPTAMIG